MEIFNQNEFVDKPEKNALFLMHDTSDNNLAVTAIKQQVRQAHRASVFIDGKYSFSLTLDQLLDSKLKKGDQLTEANIKSFKKLSDEGKLKQRALEWLLLRPHSEREFRDYMYRKKADKDLIKAWVDDFTAKKYLNDYAFAKWFADNRKRKNKSTRALQAELRSKGIANEAISSVLSDSATTDKDALRILVEKLQKRPRYQDQQKLMQHLAGKGFSYGDIKDVLHRDDG